MTTNTNTQAPCTLGVSDRTLSDFRSDGLGAKEMERLRAHVAQCPACQARLAEYEALAQRLKSQSEPNGHAQLWQNVRASIAATETPTGVRRAHLARGAGRSRSTQVWAALGSIAAALALSVGFVALFVSRGGWPAFGTHRQATPIVIHSGSLAWKQVIVPKGFPSVDQAGESATHSSPLISPTDGMAAYACQADKKYVPSPTVWATHDAGAHWSAITPANLPADIGGCRIVLDANDANTLIVSFFPVLSPSQPALPDEWVTYATFDGGATWAKPAGLNDGSVIMQLASTHDAVYVIRVTYTYQPTEISHSVLAISDNRLGSWERIDATLPETQPNPPDVHDTGKIFQMWVNPSTGEALEETYDSTFWSTTDNGAHWMKIHFPLPFMRDNTPQTSVSWAVGSHFTICAAFLLEPDRIETRLSCTVDNGRTWTDRPFPSTAVCCLEFSSIGADGSLYATLPPESSNGASDDATIYRLPPGSTSVTNWQALGTIPGTQNGYGYVIAPAGHTTVFWDTLGASTTTDAAGNSTTIVQPYYYVATYP